jgi:hypothetical protein
MHYNRDHGLRTTVNCHSPDLKHHVHPFHDLSEHRVLVVQMWGGTRDFPPGLEAIIKEAYAKGVLCVCAAGNDPDRIGYPARSQWTVSVSAVGLGAEILAGSLSESVLPEKGPPFWQGDYFIPMFSGRGKKINCCGPGVGLITAAVPTEIGTRTSWRVFGTSFASPLVCGVLAAALASDDTYLSLPRDASRADYASKKLTPLCRSLGFPVQLEGAGMPVL